jgi:hypothetical protein
MLFLIKQNVPDGVFDFSDRFQNMEMVALNLDASLVKRFCQGNREGAHSLSEKLIVDCFKDQMNVIVLKGEVDDFESLSSGVLYRPVKSFQSFLIFDSEFVFEVHVQWGEGSHFFSFTVGNAF